MTRLARIALLVGLTLAVRPAPAQAPRVGHAHLASVEFLDVGQGDAILIRSPEGKTALVDAGPHKELAANLVRGRGITSLDLVVLTHHHADHYAGMEEVIRRCRPRLFLDNGSAHTSPHYLRLLELVRDRGIATIQPADRPRRIDLGSVVLVVLPRAPENRTDENDNSVGLRLEYGDFSVLLPGDAERTERAWWEQHAADACADATILKLAHHGSNNGTDARWLQVVRPELAVASVGLGNEFGHPGSETLSLLARSRIPLLRTDRDGTIAVRTDGRTWRVAGRPHASKAPPAAARTRRKAGRPIGHHVNINTASLAELEALPGVGPVLGRRIIEGRPYRSVEELGRIREIGPRRLEEIRPLITAE